MDKKTFGISMDIPPQIVEMIGEKGADERKEVDPEAWKQEKKEYLKCECGKLIEYVNHWSVIEHSNPDEEKVRSLEWAENLYRCECGTFIYIRCRSYQEIQAYASFETLPQKEG